MSLSLIQGYSSSEEEEQDLQDEHNSSDEQDDANGSISYVSVVDLAKPSNGSALPSALDVFSQISGPPQFLNNSVGETDSAKDVDEQQNRRRRRKAKQDLPPGAVVEAKAQLVGIHDRVRSDIEGGQPGASVSSTAGVKRVATAANPNAEDAAELLRMCLQCGIPKTFSNAQGIICPVCGDRPPSDASQEAKKKASVIKEKEKSKRMKGQSSHATWKSETEMQLRQHYD